LAEAVRAVTDRNAERIKAETVSGWTRVEKNDFAALVARLRASGCPEPMIRDIVIGALNRQYGPRIATLRKRSLRFWETRERPSQAAHEQDLIREQQARQLEQERLAMIEGLFGREIANELPEFTARPNPLDELTDALSGQSQPRAKEVLRRYDQMERDVVDRANGTLGETELSDLRALYREKHSELKQFLSEAELEEFELRASPLSEELRNHDLVGFSPSEEEFRLIYRVRKEVEAAGGSGTPSATTLAHSEEGRASIEDRLARALGEERFADYARAQDFAYRRLLEITDHFGLPSEAAIQVHDLRASVLNDTEKLSQESPVDWEARRRTLQNMQVATAERIAQVLGDEAYQAYLKTPWGRWVDRIGGWTNGVVLGQASVF
jgi:hypothetical protein